MWTCEATTLRQMWGRGFSTIWSRVQTSIWPAQLQSSTSAESSSFLFNAVIGSFHTFSLHAVVSLLFHSYLILKLLFSFISFLWLSFYFFFPNPHLSFLLVLASFAVLLFSCHYFLKSFLLFYFSIIYFLLDLVCNLFLQYSIPLLVILILSFLLLPFFIFSLFLLSIYSFPYLIEQSHKYCLFCLLPLLHPFRIVLTAGAVLSILPVCV